MQAVLRIANYEREFICITVINCYVQHKYQSLKYYLE